MYQTSTSLHSSSPQSACKLHTRCKPLAQHHTQFGSHRPESHQTPKSCNSAGPSGQKLTCGTCKQATNVPKLPQEPQYETILSDAPATGMRTFPSCSLGTAQPDATAALCQPKHLTGAQLQMGTCPSCFPEKVKLRAKILTAQLARQELQETPACKPGDLQAAHTRICSTGTTAFAAPKRGNFDSIVVTSC